MPKNGPKPDASTDSAEEQSFYGRWSRRKQQVRAGHPPVQDPATLGTGDGTPADFPQDKLPQQIEAPETPLLTDADMPPLESLGAESDYSGFLSEGVSDELRNKALRKLFLSPQFNIVDGLDDYCEDFTSFEVLGDIITSDMRYEREYEARRALDKAQEQDKAQELEREPEQTATLEAEPDTLEGAGPADEQSTSPDVAVSPSPLPAAGEESAVGSSESGAGGNIARSEVPAVADTPLADSPGDDDDKPSVAAT